jgi:hypothetical protein
VRITFRAIIHCIVGRLYRPWILCSSWPSVLI